MGWRDPAVLPGSPIELGIPAVLCVLCVLCGQQILVLCGRQILVLCGRQTLGAQPWIPSFYQRPIAVSLEKSGVTVRFYS